MNILYIASMSKKRNKLDGETIKSRLLEDYLKKMQGVNVISIDTENWKKNVFKLVYLIFKNYFIADKIVISCADRGARIVLDFFRRIQNKKDIFYFVVGGALAKNITQNQWNILTYTRLKAIYVEAEKLKSDLCELGIKNVKVINNFRKVNSFKNRYNTKNFTRFVFYGRIIKEKGIEQAINLINKLNKQGYNCKLDIYGQGEKEYIKNILRGIDENIKYLGAITPNNKIEYETLSSYDIFILPTEYPGECLPGALIDAYISGLAVIVSDWKYAKEYVKHNENGIIFDYKDYDDMYNKTKKMLDDKKIEEYKEKSLQISKKYDIEEVLKNFKKEILE